MEKTPQSKNNQEVNSENLDNSNSKIFESENPGYIPFTQEGFENIDVTWDWNSPQSKKIPKKSQKRLALPQSPKKTLKRHLSNNSIQFEKIQEELRLLKEEIAIPEHEESLLLSPIEEAEYKNVNDSISIHNIELENFINETEDFFNDSLDEQLLVCTTQIESQLTKVISKRSQCDNISNLITCERKINNNKLKHDSLHISNVNTLTTKLCIMEKDLDHIGKNSKFTYKNNKNSVVSLGKVEFHKTQSFEMSNLENVVGLPINKKEEIERKRQEALAKLELKKKIGSNNISPIQCSSEEIEKKRKEAVAKREARKQQEIIEKNRQNALKRLEVSRKKILKM